jgi:hypothetical protein
MAESGCHGRHQRKSNSGETTMRPASLYYLTQAWASSQRRQGGPSRTTRRGRHAMAPRRYHPARELPALARRVFAALAGTSQPA